jgi:hypothetical protein
MDAEQNIVSAAEHLLPPTEGARRGLSKPYRVGVVLRVIEQGPPCVSAEDMVAYVNLVFREDSSNYKERMYGPSPLQRKKNSTYAGALEYWATAHTIWCGHNGSLRIETRGAPQAVTVILDKAGIDGRGVVDP